MPKLPSVGFEFASLLAVVPAVVLLASCMRSNGPTPLDEVMRPRDQGSARWTPAPTAKQAAPRATAAALVGDASWYKPRSEWSASRIDNSNIDPMQSIYRLTIHHSGVADDAIGDPEKHLRDFERVHQAKGWACIGYHFVISRGGVVYEARPLKYQGAHATGDNNIGNIGVCLLGNFDNRAIPTAQRQALQAVVDRLRKQHGIKRSNLFGHRDFKGTDCPGRYVTDWIEAYKGG